MSVHDYRLVSHWRLPGSAKDVREILAEYAQYPRWWPAGFIDVLLIDSADNDRVIRVKTRGCLPLTATSHLRFTAEPSPDGFAFNVWGDFEGTGSWTFSENGAWSDATFDWQITVRKGLLRHVGWLGRPLFIANHRWAMARGEESLRLELARRRAENDVARTAIPAAPQPGRWPALPAVMLSLAVGVVLLLRRRRQP